MTFLTKYIVALDLRSDERWYVIKDYVTIGDGDLDEDMPYPEVYGIYFSKELAFETALDLTETLNQGVKND